METKLVAMNQVMLAACLTEMRRRDGEENGAVGERKEEEKEARKHCHIKYNRVDSDRGEQKGRSG